MIFFFHLQSNATFLDVFDEFSMNSHPSSTSAMSLLYECINTVIAVLISISSGLPDHNSSIQLCVQKLRILIEVVVVSSQLLTSGPQGQSISI